MPGKFATSARGRTGRGEANPSFGGSVIRATYFFSWVPGFLIQKKRHQRRKSRRLKCVRKSLLFDDETFTKAAGSARTPDKMRPKIELYSAKLHRGINVLVLVLAVVAVAALLLSSARGEISSWVSASVPRSFQSVLHFFHAERRVADHTSGARQGAAANQVSTPVSVSRVSTQRTLAVASNTSTSSQKTGVSQVATQAGRSATNVSATFGRTNTVGIGSRTISNSTGAKPSAPDAILAVDEYWRTDGTTGGTWTSAFWNIGSANATGGTGWTAGSNAFFTANSTLTFATNAVGNVSLSDGVTVTVTAAGTLTLGGIRTFDIGTGSMLTWTSQSQSTAAANEGAGIIKNGAGTLNWGAGPGTNVRYNGGFTLNAGTVIVTGSNSLSSGVMTFNGGTLQSSGGITFTSSSVVIGGDFAFAGTGDDIWNMTVATGSSNRTITNNTTGSATRTFSNIISGSGGLTFAGTGGSGGIVLSGANDYIGGTTLSGGLLKLSGSGALGSTSGSLTVNGGTLDLGGTSQTVGALSGSGGTINASTGTSTLTVGNGGGTGSHSGTIANGVGTVALIKTGGGTQTLSGSEHVYRHDGRERRHAAYQWQSIFGHWRCHR